MAVFTAVITLDGTAQQAFPTAPNFGVRKVMIEPLRANTHGFNVGDSTVTIDGSGTGVISQVGQPPAATVANSGFVDEAQSGYNNVPATAYYVRGTATEKLLASYWTV